jgi:acyl-coenzyme A thioesterase PaaI-like protein
MTGLRAGTLPLNSMAETLGYDIVEASDGRVAITAAPTTAYLNPAGTVHGGLADTKGRILAHGTTTCLIFEY